MVDTVLSSDQVIANLIEMGFDISSVIEAVKGVGPSIEDAVEYILNSSRRNCDPASSNSKPSTSTSKRKTSSLGKTLQPTIVDLFHSSSINKRSRDDNVSDVPVCMNQCKESESRGCSSNLNTVKEKLQIFCEEELDLNMEECATSVLKRHFGYESLKSFQKEALAAWVAHQDCLILAATGSGKSLCFQLPALLTGKVVVVISPLISLMHDQCLKLSKHGVAACFLGSGQPDNTVEKKAMRGMYDIIYVCPETILRLIKPLQELAESRGIALFAIDEVHCVSKWGHDFRPDYRRLSALRENFSARNLKFLKFDIPLMALTATATIQVREDIVEALSMSKETKIVLTSFFRPNLRFSVKHSRTNSPSSYEKDFQKLIDIYAKKRKIDGKEQSIMVQELSKCFVSFGNSGISEDDGFSESDLNSIEDDCSVAEDLESESTSSEGMSIEYLENEVDDFQGMDDLDVTFGEYCGQSPYEHWDACRSSKTTGPNKPDEFLKLLHEPLEEGATIIYVPTRKETLTIAKYLCSFGVKAAAYNASLPKSHLRQVHKEFHENLVQVIVATIAFGMGIDKLNIRRVIHYGWPQSLEAYYQEAGRAGRDGKLSECILYANLSRIPSLLPSRRSEDQTKQAYRMLSDCFRYGMNTSCCRAKVLVEYFGEDFSYEKCLSCDVCVNGPPEMQNLKEEVNIFIQAVAAYHDQCSYLHDSYDVKCSGVKLQKPDLRMFVSKIREQSQKFLERDQLWWQGLARIMGNQGYIKESNDKLHVQVKFPKPTKLGLEFLEFKREQPFYVYPEADMLLSINRQKSYSAFADWGKGWADPEIRRQRLGRIRSNKKPRQPRKRKPSKRKPDLRTARVGIAAKLFKQK